MKQAICMILALFLCLSLAGCSHGGSGIAESNGAPTQQENQPGLVPTEQTQINQPAEVTSVQPTTRQAEETEPAQSLNQPDETGKYRHEIDGIVFYTEHDLEQWIVRDESLYPKFNFEQMAKDIFGDKVDDSGPAFVILNIAPGYLEYGNSDLYNSTAFQAKEGYYPYFSSPTNTIFDMGPGNEKEYYMPYYFINDSYYCTDYELLEISLYACEAWARGDYYAFETFAPSMRFMIVHK